ncbi:MAG: serine--tRNA ligase [Candidatus Micrarchaeota archaeon]
MLDIKIIRNDPELVRDALRNRQYDSSVVDTLVKLDKKWRKNKKEEEELRAQRNKLGLAISDAKKKDQDQSAEEFVKKSGEIGAKIKQLSEETESLEKEILGIMLNIPNIPHKSVPVGKDETSNVEIKKWGHRVKNSENILSILSHDVIGEKLGLLDFERGAKLGGHRFTVMYGALAKLERAIANFMLNVHSSRGYTEVWVPHLVKSEIMRGTGQLPKFANDQYKTDDDLWLIPTAEVPLTNLHAGEVIQPPKKYTSFTPCYRREAGAYGKDITGMIRQHQFDKVELVKFSCAEKSFDALEDLVRDAEYILQLLELPYRVVLLCTGDMGFASAKTYDIEVWIPSQNKYREISSCSNCTDFQARRANIKYRDKDELKFAHTLNGSGLAVGRTLIAILENYQDRDGVIIPKMLRDYVGMEKIWIPS